VCVVELPDSIFAASILGHSVDSYMNKVVLTGHEDEIHIFVSFAAYVLPRIIPIASITFRKCTKLCMAIAIQ